MSHIPLENQSQQLVLSKLSTAGIKVDKVTPTYPFYDIIGYITPKTIGVWAPTLSVFTAGAVRSFAYWVWDDWDIVFHIPHDYVLGTPLFFHAHRGHNGTAISWSFVLTYNFSYAKRTLNSPAVAFVADKVLTHTINTGIDITNTPRYAHRVDEIAITSAWWSASTLDVATIEPDGLIQLHYDITTIPTISGWSPNEPFIFTLDCHYQSTGIGTKNKDPDYYA